MSVRLMYVIVNVLTCQRGNVTVPVCQDVNMTVCQNQRVVQSRQRVKTFVEVNIRPPTMLVKLFTLAQDLHPRLLVKSIFHIFINKSWLLVTATSTFSGASKLCNRTSSPFIFHFGFWDESSRVYPITR